ncbi:hypothetical protein HK098_006731 [Nowakowskiella sp. JEL0407]|nr:hypothetical protein HK098_006731 [Nowakowskiella sp. JEL0407]
MVETNSTTEINEAELFQDVPSLQPDRLQRIIYEYLIHNCYSETAELFLSNCSPPSTTEPNPQSSNTEYVQTENPGGAVAGLAGVVLIDDEGDLVMDSDEVGNGGQLELWEVALRVKTVEARKHLYQLIVSGKLGEAIEFCRQKFPAVVSLTTPESTDVYFQLCSQQFIEIVRQNAVDAVKFVNSVEFLKFYMNPKYTDSFVDLTSLLAYPDPEKSPVSHLLLQDRRDSVAKAVNSFILACENLPRETSIEKIVRQTTVVRDLLGVAVKEGSGNRRVTTYPRWKLEDFLNAKLS